MKDLSNLQHYTRSKKIVKVHVISPTTNYYAGMYNLQEVQSQVELLEHYRNDIKRTKQG